MTREQNFRTSFISQFGLYSGWQNIPHKEIRKLPLSLFPSFSLGLSRTNYTSFDPLGKAIAGEQDFSITVYYELPLYDLENAYLGHSDITNVLEQFINNPVYLPPSVLPGDTYRIECTTLSDGKAPAIPLGETRFSMMIQGKYHFTIF
ncbi:MAG: hypothetical protein ABI778_04830 [Ignavibacteriota bacterium]